MHGLDGFGREIRHAARRLVRSPAFTLPAALTLAVAIGANASMFAVVQRVLLNPLPYPDADRLIALDHGARGLNMATGIQLSPGLYHHYRDRVHALEAIALHRTTDLTLTGRGEPERIRVARTTTSLAGVLGVSPARGRWFSTSEGEPGAAPVAILSHGLWMRRYGGDPGVIGGSVRLDGVPTEVIAVMPASFAFPDVHVDAWLPEPIARSDGFGFFLYAGVARLRDGATLASARAGLDEAIADLPAAFPGYASGIGYHLQLFATPLALKEATVGHVARPLWILLASVGLVLLAACANVANLFLVRSETRQREVAVRRALGAATRDIARFFLAESVLLAIAGGVAGLAIAWYAVDLLVSLGPAHLPRLDEVRVDGVAIAFTCGLTMMVALLFGAVPIWRGTLRRGAALSVSLQESGRGHTASRGRHRLRHLLMGGQIALALVLLVSSGLMVRSFAKLRAVDPGYDAGSALTFRLGLPSRDYASRQAAVAAHHAIVDAVAALPGVTAVSASTVLPLAEEGVGYGNVLFVDGRPLPANALPPSVAFRAVAADYLQAMGMRLLRGRGIDRAAIDRQEPIAVIDDTLAKVFFPNEDPIGKRVASSSPQPTWLTIAGVVANVPVTTLAERQAMPTLYMPMSIAGGPDIPVSTLVGPDVSVMSYVVRTATPPRGLGPSVRRAVTAVDANLALVQVRTLQDILDRASAHTAFTMVLLAIAAGVALLLGVIGIYGVMSYIVSQRTSEIGLRLALGASPSVVAGAIVRQGALVAVAGIIVGVAAALAGGRLMESLLYGVSPRDPFVFAATTVLLLAIALAACWLPARRAARLSPLQALRAE